jgi:hypothetical protein
MTAETVSTGSVENTRKRAEKMQTEILQRISKVSQTVAAKRLGVSDSTISRMKDELGEVTQLLASINLKVVASDAVVMTQEEMRVLKRWGIEYLEADLEKDLIKGDI